MSETLKQRTENVLATLSGAYKGTPVTKELIAVWHMAIQGLTEEQIRNGLAHTALKHKTNFLPAPALFLEYCNVVVDDDVNITKAFASMVHAVKTYGSYATITWDEDPVIAEVIEQLGGWVQLCSMSEAELQKQIFSFKSLYKSIKSSIPPHLLRKETHGLVQLDAQTKGYERQDKAIEVGGTVDLQRREQEKREAQQALEHQERLMLEHQQEESERVRSGNWRRHWWEEGLEKPIREMEKAEAMESALSIMKQMYEKAAEKAGPVSRKLRPPVGRQIDGRVPFDTKKLKAMGTR